MTSCAWTFTLSINKNGRVPPNPVRKHRVRKQAPGRVQGQHSIDPTVHGCPSPLSGWVSCLLAPPGLVRNCLVALPADRPGAGFVAALRQVREGRASASAPAYRLSLCLGEAPEEQLTRSLSRAIGLQV